MSEPAPASLSLETLDPDPIRQFEIWFRDAIEGSGLALPEAMCLSTVGEDGYAEGRVVLLKGVDAKGFVFFTNLDSPKARSLRIRPKAALTFYWEALRRQVRVQGEVDEVTSAESEAYFTTRPRGSQIGAWASQQSALIPDREELEDRYRALERQFEGKEVPRPPNWGGLRLRPRSVEFWQERPNRLHDRFVYRMDDRGAWHVSRLSP